MNAVERLVGALEAAGRRQVRSHLDARNVGRLRLPFEARNVHVAKPVVAEPWLVNLFAAAFEHIFVDLIAAERVGVGARMDQRDLSSGRTADLDPHPSGICDTEVESPSVALPGDAAAPATRQAGAPAERSGRPIGPAGADRTRTGFQAEASKPG